jgi:hypothetical protein
MSRLQVYTVYAPQHHKPGKVHPTKTVADTDTDDEAAEWSVQPRVARTSTASLSCSDWPVFSQRAGALCATPALPFADEGALPTAQSLDGPMVDRSEAPRTPQRVWDWDCQDGGHPRGRPVWSL